MVEAQCSMPEQARELHLRRKDGAELWVRVSTNPLFNEQEQFTGTCAMVMEIAESREQRDQTQLWSGLR
jgi:PAS domain S-box-containing protein